jgi:hypothetical protein
MLLFASCIILKRQVGPSVAVLATVIVGQAIAYGLIFDLVCYLAKEECNGYSTANNYSSTIDVLFT